MPAPTFGIATDDQALLGMCRFGLQELGEVEPLDPALLTLGAPLSCEVLVLDLGDPLREGIRTFACCREANDELPVVVVGHDVTADLSAELIRLGAADFLSIPFDADTLARKVTRLLDGTVEPTIRLETLRPFAQLAPRQRRRSRRVNVPTGHPARARLLNDRGFVTAEIIDLSLEVDGWPGGIRLRLRAGALGVKQLLDATDGVVLPLQLKLPRIAGPLTLAGRIVWSCHDSEQGTIDMALQYRPTGPHEASAVRDFWTECLEQSRRPVAPVSRPCVPAAG